MYTFNCLPPPPLTGETIIERGEMHMLPPIGEKYAKCTYIAFLVPQFSEHFCQLFLLCVFIFYIYYALQYPQKN